ncbi:MAG: polysaccharide deacetylase family protein [Acidimicrobiaceae bacterium]|nr:polysaccharide deacetylase family protein [Acidimicrobiaceae bacterium]
MSPYSQLFGDFSYKGMTSGKVVALTFDDGPNEPFTSEIADFLRTRAVTATFFQVGRCVDRNPEVTERLAREGHLIGTHSYSHRFRHCLRWSIQKKDIERGQQTLTTLLGRRPALFRPPWLFRHPSMLRTLRVQGLEPISGEFAHVLEVFQPSPERIARRALAKVRPGAILIFHDGFDARTGPRGRTVEAVKLVVDHLLRDGYSFATIDELLGIPGYHAQGKS